MSILQEAIDSVALDRDPQMMTQSARESALEWLCHDVGNVTVMQVAERYIAQREYWRRTETGGDYPWEQLVHRGTGRTPALAIMACARAAGWPG